MIQRSDVTAVAAITLLLGVVVGAVLTGALTAASGDEPEPETTEPETTEPVSIDTGGSGVTTFDTAAEYRAFLQRDANPTLTGASSPNARFDVAEQSGDAMEERATDDAAATDGGDSADVGGAADGGDANVGGDATADAGGSGGESPRHSETNVQVRGIDEPDVLKTDGEWVYYAGSDWRWHSTEGDTDVIDARSPDAPERNGTIPTGGQLLRSGDVLVTIEHDTIYGYDVSDPANPEERWQRQLNHSVQTARLANGTLYLVTEDRSYGHQPCPVRPLDASSADDERAVPAIDCTDVYRPAGESGGDTTYTATAVDPETGAVGDQVGFAGSGSNTVVYVSQDAIYLTYEESPSRIETRLAFLEGPASEHLDEQALDRLATIQEYDLTDDAMRAELQAVVQRQRERLSPEERADFEEAMTEDWDAYVEAHKRELLRTGVVRVDVDGSELAVDGTGEVPGRVDDQFALSERNGHLHVATTVNPHGAEWENDLYTLDDDLEVADSVTGLGVGQRIYSVRYVEDRAYLVTFRQVDPFYVIDVSDPTALERLGKLKLPGYSDYMHPLETDRILGIGEEEGQVKATVFDASDPADPVVEDDLQFADRSTEISRDHHGFLLDERHEVFFLPGSNAGHVVSYADGLERVATVETDGPARRALYIGDYLYVFGVEELVVLDQTDWSEVHRTDL